MKDFTRYSTILPANFGKLWKIKSLQFCKHLTEDSIFFKIFLKVKTIIKNFQERCLSQIADRQITQHPSRTRDRQGILHSSVAGSSRSSKAIPIAAFQNKEPLPDKISPPVPLFVTKVARASQFTHYVSCSLCNRRKNLHMALFKLQDCVAGNVKTFPYPKPKDCTEIPKYQAGKSSKFSKADGWATRQVKNWLDCHAQNW